MDNSEQCKVFGNNLKYLIELSGKEQKNIAIDLDVNYTTFNTWVRGRSMPNYSQLVKLAEYFNTTLYHIVDPPEDISDFDKLTGYYRGMNEEGRADLLKYARLLYTSGQFAQWDKNDRRKQLPLDYIVFDSEEDSKNGKS